MNLQLILLIAGVVALISFGLWWIVRAPARSGRGAGTGDRRLAQQADAPLELLRVEFDPASGDREDALRVWITGRRIARVDDIADDDLREPLRRLLQWLVPAPLAPGTSKTADVGAGARPAPLAPAPPPAPDLPAERADEFNAPFFARLRDSLTPQPYTAPQTPPAQGTPRPKKAASRSEEPDKIAGMFAQINEIVQLKRRQQPGLPEMEIIGEAGGLLIKVGGQMYHEVDAVPDERARALIRAAVAEWEAR